MPWPFRGNLPVVGASLETHAFGPPPSDASTLVFLHEGLGSTAMWRDFPEALAERTGLGGLVFSRAGYGGSAPAVLPRRTTYMHDEAKRVLPSLLEAAGVTDPVLVGHSDGASIALIYAGGDAGPRPRVLLLEAPHVFVERISVESITKARDVFRTTDLPERLQRYHTLPVEQVFWGWNDIWLNPAFAAWNVEEVLPRVTAPTLVVQGENDEYGTWAQVTAIARAVRGPFTAERVPQCGHSPHKDQRERTLAAMAAFLRTHLPSA